MDARNRNRTHAVAPLRDPVAHLFGIRCGDFWPNPQRWIQEADVLTLSLRIVRFGDARVRDKRPISCVRST